MPSSRDSTPEKPSLIWTRLEKPARGQQPSLSREHIIRAAMELADAEGIEALSMRRIAAQIGVGTMSLYWHIARKQDLFDLLFDAALGEMQLAEYPSGNWRADLWHLAFEMHTVLLRHSWLGALFDSQPPYGPNGLRIVEHCLAAIDGLGLEGATMVMVLETLTRYVIGVASSKMADETARRRSGVSEEAWQAVLSPYLQQAIATGHYPTFARVLAASRPPDTETSFEFGLNCFLNGIARCIGG
jgi:AcrR family transcriptional regulator